MSITTADQHFLNLLEDLADLYCVSPSIAAHLEAVVSERKLAFLRGVHGRLAFIRDGSLCQFHYRQPSAAQIIHDSPTAQIRRRASESHHVIGRGSLRQPRSEAWWRRLSLCRACHYAHHGQGKISRQEMLSVLAAANSDPTCADWNDGAEYEKILLVKDWMVIDRD